MKAIRTLWRTEEVEVEKQITVKEIENQDKKFIVIELDEDDVDTMYEIVNYSWYPTDEKDENGEVKYSVSLSSYNRVNRDKLRAWAKLVHNVMKAWDE